MKVVIIGSGKIGSNISNALSKEGHDVTVIDVKKTALDKIQDIQDVLYHYWLKCEIIFMIVVMLFYLNRISYRFIVLEEV